MLGGIGGLGGIKAFVGRSESAKSKVGQSRLRKRLAAERKQWARRGEASVGQQGLDGSKMEAPGSGEAAVGEGGQGSCSEDNEQSYGGKEE